MSSSVGFHVKSKVFESNCFEDDDIFENEDDEFDNQGYLYEVPYTSNSVDRSSIGSIPWADDAIKINKVAWDKVENMISGLESLSAAEDELSKEILDWQSKFPQLLNKNPKFLRSESLDIDSLHSLVITSDEENNAEDKRTLIRNRIIVDKSTSKSSEDDSNLCQLMGNFTLKSVPIQFTQRETNKHLINRRKCSSSTTSYSLRSPPTPTQVPLATTSTNRFRMPPILNVFDSRKKFRNLGQNKNQSFVQLTQIQQAKSAAVAHEQKPRSRFHTGRRSAWHLPFAVNRFSHNKNSIILPSITSRHQVIDRYTTQPTITSSNSEIGTSDTIASFNETRDNFIRANNNNKRIDFTTSVSTQTNTSHATTSGRSISAAVKYPRFNALYLPYSASKFHPFNYK